MHICNRRSQRTKVQRPGRTAIWGPRTPSQIRLRKPNHWAIVAAEKGCPRPPPRQDWHASSSVRVRFCSAILYRNMQSKFSNFPSLSVRVCVGVKGGLAACVHWPNTHSHTLGMNYNQHTIQRKMPSNF